MIWVVQMQLIIYYSLKIINKDVAFCVFSHQQS